MVIIPIAYAINDSFASLCSVSIASIIKNCNLKNNYIINILYTRLSKKNIKMLTEMSTKNIQIKFINLNKIVDFSMLYELDNFSYEIYYRLYIPHILNYDKVVYLDADTIVLSDIYDLYKINIDSYDCGAVVDYTFFKKSKKYYNSGILLFNSNLYKQNDILNRCLDMLNNNIYKFPDQDVLNKIANIKELPLFFNYQIKAINDINLKLLVRSKYKELFNLKPKIIHYTFDTKPLDSCLSKYSNLFWRYSYFSPYYEDISKNYLENDYKKIKYPNIEYIYLNKIRDGKIGLKVILSVTIISFKNWLLYKVRKR